jgi:polysaccharide pyruvyl transferase WcaK-like protein
MTTRRIKMSFTGYYGMGNFGDDLFGLICSAAAERYWGCQPRLVGPPIPGVTTNYTMPQWYPPKIYGARGSLGKVSRYCSFMRGVLGSDVMILGGGSVVQSRESFRQPIMAAAQRRGRLKLAAVGISIGPFDSPDAEASAASFLKHFSYIAVRDRRSYELAVKMGLGETTHNGRDLAGLLPLLAPSSMSSGRDHKNTDGVFQIGVALCNYDESKAYPAPDKQGLLLALVAALKRLSAQRPTRVSLFSLNEHDLHGDRAFASALGQQLRAAGIEVSMFTFRGCSPMDAVLAIGRCQAFISARLHGAIAAYMQGIPFTIVDYHRKCRDFAEDVGLNPAQQITIERQDEAAVDRAITAMLEESALPSLSHTDYARQSLDIFKQGPWWVE